MSSEVRRIEKKFEKRWSDLKKASYKEIATLWDKHDKLSLSGATNTHTKQGILGKIVGIEWVLKMQDQIQHKEERDLRF